ncbi:C4-dicarboxylate ABC transporter [Chryseobacterium taklimakanense]|nr:C4-dicarboxylate ABC transporter [Chryseobacterium taklimakanense]
MGIFVIIYKFFVITLDPTVSYLLGGLMIVYGIFRIFRAVYRLRENKNED